MNAKLLYTSFFFLLFLSSCHDDLEISTTIDEEVPSPEVIQESQGDIIGYVFDEDKNPIANVEINTYAENVKSDQYGVFRLENTKLDGNGTFILAEHDAYIIGSDMIYPNNGLNHSYIQLLSLSQTGDFFSSAGGIINAEGGGQVIFDANTIANSDGTPYNGQVVVTAKRIGPETPDYIDQMPGALVAQDHEGYTRVLGTLGMLAVELRSPDGKELNILAGNTAELRFQLSAEQLQNTPESIPVWYFDNDRKLWIEEGAAQLQGNMYITEVSHFSFWNCDAPFPLVHVCGHIYYDNGAPAENIKISVSVENFGSSCGYTDSKGEFCGKMPKGVPLTISIFNPFCPEEIQTIDVGPFGQNTQLDDIILNTQTFELFGQVTCLQQAVTDGYLVISANEVEAIYPLNEEGNYEINLSSVLCANIDQFEVFAVNAENGQASTPIMVDLTNEELNLNIEVCADCEFEVEIIEGDITDCNQVTLSADIKSGSGDYNISWDTNETGEEILSYGGLICVTVLDNLTQCDQTVCKNVEERTKFIVSVDILNASCGMNNGLAERVVDNGIAPFEFEWTNENGDVISNDAFIENLAPGSYTLNATDANGCESSASFEILDAGDIQLSFEFEIICPETWVYPFVFGGTGPFEFSSDDGQTGQFFVFSTPGEYCITAIDDNGCQVEECFAVEDYPEPFYSATQECFGFYYDIMFNDFNGFQYQINIDNEIVDTTFFFSDGDLWTYNILDLGFQFEAFINDGFNPECQSYAIIQLPNYTGLEIVVNEASCDICEDGWIEASLSVDGDCWSCEEELIEIYAEDDLINELSNINDAVEMPAGNYYVVVKDTEGCVVAFELVTL